MLVDTDCTETLLCKLCCQTWERKEVPMLTVGRSSLICCGESVVRIGIGTGPPVAVRTLVVGRELLGYDLLLGLDAITQLGWMAMSGTGEVRFPQHRTLICAAIILEEPDFHAEYDESKLTGLHHQNGLVNSCRYLWITGSQNVPPLSNSKVNMSRSCRLGFRTAGWFCTQKTNIPSWIIMNLMSMLVHKQPTWTFVCTNLGSGRGRMS